MINPLQFQSHTSVNPLGERNLRGSSLNRIILCFLALSLFPLIAGDQAHAQGGPHPIEKIEIQVLDPYGYPVIGAPVEYYGSSLGEILSDTTDSSGFAYLHKSDLSPLPPETGTLTLYAHGTLEEKTESLTLIEYSPETDYDTDCGCHIFRYLAYYDSNTPSPNLTIAVVDSDGAPQGDVPVVIQQLDSWYDSSFTDSQGLVVFYSPPGGLYEVIANPKGWNDSSPDFPETRTTLNFDSTGSDVTEVVELGTFAHTIEVRVVETNADGSLSERRVKNAQVDAWELIPPESDTTNGDFFYSHGETGSDGTLDLGLVQATLNKIGVSVRKTGYSEGYREVRLSKQGNTTLARVGLRKTNAAVQYQIFRGGTSGEAFPVPENSYGDVACFSVDAQETNPVHFFSPIEPGESSGSIAVTGGLDYECRAWIEGSGYSEQQVFVPVGGSKNVNFYIHSPNSQLVVEFRDEQGQLVTGLPMELSLWTDRYDAESRGELENFVDHSVWSRVEAGTETFEVIEGQRYFAYAHLSQFPADLNPRTIVADNGSEYVIPFQIEPVVISSEGPNKLVITLERADEFIRVRLFDQNGEPLAASPEFDPNHAGWVHAYSPGLLDGDDEEGSTENIIPGETVGTLPGEEEVLDEFWTDGLLNTKGEAELGVRSGRRYYVSAGPFLNPEKEGDFLPPPDREVVVEAGGGPYVVDFRLQQPNFTLRVNLEGTDDEGNALDFSRADFIGCFAFNDRKHNYAESRDGTGKVKLALRIDDLRKSEQWEGGCHVAFFPQNDSGETFGDQYFAEFEFKNKRLEEQRRLTITLENFGTYFPAEEQEVNLSSESEVKLFDGESSLRVPAGALGEGEQAVFEIKSATGWRQYEGGKVKDALDITPKVDGVAIERPSKAIRYCTPVNVAQFEAQYGVSPSAIRLARYDTQTRQWLPTVTEVLGSGEVVRVCADLNHFSIWGQIIDVIKEIRQSAPENLNVRFNKGKKKRKKRIRFTWDAPENAPATTEYVLEYASKARKKKRCSNLPRTKFKSVNVIGTRKAIRKQKRMKKICAQVSVKDGVEPASRTFRKLR